MNAPAPAQAATATFTLDDRDAIVRAIRYLAGMCDGAINRDNVGFDGTDTKRGHYLARLEASRWLDYQIYWGWTRLKKYRRQLEGAGYRTEITAPPKVDYPTFEERRGHVTQSVPHLREIRFVPGGFEVRFNYDANLVAAIRAIPGRRYDKGVNYIPADQEAAVKAFGLAHGFVWNSL